MQSESTISHFQPQALLKRPIVQTTLLILIITFSAAVTPIAIRYTQAEGVPSLAIVFIRFFLSTLVMTPFVWERHKTTITNLRFTDWLWGLSAGFWLALNVLALFFALEYTSVLVTGILRRMTPIWTILPEIFLLGAVFTWRTWAGTVISIIGVVGVTLGAADAINAGSQPMLGAGIALAGSVFFGIYLLIGRKLSRALPSLVYSWMVFICASIITGAFVLVTSTPLTGYSITGYLWVVLVAFLSQYMGHVSINLGLRFFSATMMSILLELGVVLSAVIALVAFQEIPTSLQILGSALIITGVVLASSEPPQHLQPTDEK